MTAILLTACLKAIAKALHNAHAPLDLRFFDVDLVYET